VGGTFCFDKKHPKTISPITRPAASLRYSKNQGAAKSSTLLLCLKWHPCHFTPNFSPLLAELKRGVGQRQLRLDEGFNYDLPRLIRCQEAQWNSGLS